MLLMNTDSLVQCSSYFSSMFGSLWKRSSKNYTIPKKKETIALRCGLIRKKYQFLSFPSFRFCPIPKIENLEISESFILPNFLVVYETSNRKYDLKEKTLTLQCGLKRKSAHFRGFRVCPILEIENLETSESFRLLYFFIVSVALSMGKIKTFH